MSDQDLPLHGFHEDGRQGEAVPTRRRARRSMSRDSSAPYDHRWRSRSQSLEDSNLSFEWDELNILRAARGRNVSNVNRIGSNSTTAGLPPLSPASVNSLRIFMASPQLADPTAQNNGNQHVDDEIQNASMIEPGGVQVSVSAQVHREGSTTAAAGATPASEAPPPYNSRNDDENSHRSASRSNLDLDTDSLLTPQDHYANLAAAEMFYEDDLESLDMNFVPENVLRDKLVYANNVKSMLQESMLFLDRNDNRNFSSQKRKWTRIKKSVIQVIATILRLLSEIEKQRAKPPMSAASTPATVIQRTSPMVPQPLHNPASDENVRMDPTANSTHIQSDNSQQQSSPNPPPPNSTNPPPPDPPPPASTAAQVIQVCPVKN